MRRVAASRRRLLAAAGLVGLGGAPPAAGAPPDTARADADAPRRAVFVDDFLDPRAPDETAAVARAVEAAARAGMAVAFSGREYRIADTVELPSGIHLLGAGAVAGPGPNGTHGTVLKRVRDRVVLRARGTSFRQGGPMRHSVALRDILFDGGDHPSDVVQFVAASRMSVRNCFFHRARGRHLLLWETFDSRITDTDFEWGGSAGSGPAMIELRSGLGMEYTNQIHFVGCRCESYPGTAIALTGANTNKIFFTNCKLESLVSNDPALTMTGASVVRFGGLQITARGREGGRIGAMVQAQDCFGLYGDVVVEHAAWDGAAARLGSYLDLGRVQAVDLALLAIDGQTVLPPQAYVRFDAARSRAVSVRGLLRRGREIVRQEWTV